MKKKLFSFLFVVVLILGVQVPIINNLTTKILDGQKLDNKEYLPLQWEQEMEDIYNENPDTGIIQGKFVDYYADSRTYYLKQDIDYSEMVNDKVSIYDDLLNIMLTPDSTFNGNNHQIINRYDHDQFQDFLDKNGGVFQLFIESESGRNKLNSLYLFNQLDNQRLINLTFNNSPFVVNKILGFSTLHNVNLMNVNISNLKVELSPRSTEYLNEQKQNNFTLPILAFRVGVNTIIENSYYDYISFENNEFNLTQNDETNLGLNVSFSLIMFISAEEEFFANPAIFKNLEYDYWIISNNTVISDGWKDTYINENLITFTPFFVGGIAFSEVNYELDNSNLLKNRKLPTADLENSINISDIYFNHFTIENNIGTIKDKNNDKNAFNFIMLPMFNDDNLIYLSYQTILLGEKIDIVTDDLQMLNYLTSKTNTVFSYSNLMYSETVSDILANEISSTWHKETNENLFSKKFKEGNFNNSYWNGEVENEALSLKKESNFIVDPNIFNKDDNQTYFHVDSLINNFLPTYFSYELSKRGKKSKWEVLASEEITDEDSLVFYQNNFSKDILLNDFNFQRNDKIRLKVNTSRSDNSLVFSKEINNQQANFFIYDFNNSYDSKNKEFQYSFLISDTFKQIKGWRLSIYQRSKRLFSVEVRDNNVLPYSETIDLDNQKDLYFVFEIIYDIDGVENSTILIPNNDNFKLGEVNYIDSFVTNQFSWIHYNWWTIVVLVLFLLFLFFIFLMLFKIRKSNKKMSKTKEAMSGWIASHRDNFVGAELFNEFIHQENYHPYQPEDYHEEHTNDYDNHKQQHHYDNHEQNYNNYEQHHDENYEQNYNNYEQQHDENYEQNYTNNYESHHDNNKNSEEKTVNSNYKKEELTEETITISPALEEFLRNLNDDKFEK